MSFFIMLPVSVPNASLGVVPRADIDYLLPYDPTSKEHWIFDTESAACLEGRKGGAMLTVQGIDPAYGAGYLSLVGSVGNALLTPFTEAASARDTWCAVVRAPASSNGSVNALFGNGTGRNGTGTLTIFNAATPKRFAAAVGASASYQAIGFDSPAGSWYFVAIARDMSVSLKHERLYVGGVGQGDTADHFTYAANANAIALGNGYLTTSSAALVDFAEFILFDDFLSYDDIAAVYADSKARMAERGITVV